MAGWFAFPILWVARMAGGLTGALIVEGVDGGLSLQVDTRLAEIIAREVATWSLDHVTMFVIQLHTYLINLSAAPSSCSLYMPDRARAIKHTYIVVLSVEKNTALCSVT